MKLALRDSCYTGIPGMKKTRLEKTSLYKERDREADLRIKRAHARYARAYGNARTYLGD